MSKRSRALYEAELQALQSPFVAFGTPLPPIDPDVRDDGSYVPVWKQEVRDEKGRRRFHGAFTGGWSAGYFNTVGSQEGWTPSTFVSSRTNRRKDDPNAMRQRAEDFMDEEDLADAEEAKKIQTSSSFSGLGLTQNDSARSAVSAGLADLFFLQGETMGTKLLKKMGWKEGQGIGPKVRRTASLGMLSRPENAAPSTFLFAPKNVAPVRLVKKTDRKGLGFEGEERLAPLVSSSSLSSTAARLGTVRRFGSGADDGDGDNGNDSDGDGLFSRPTMAANKKKAKKIRGNGIGFGLLGGDAGSDDEDPYDFGPRITYNRVLGGGDDSKKKKNKKKHDADGTGADGPTTAPASKLVFSSRRRPVFGKTAGGARLCHDGRPPLAGFVFGREPDALVSEINQPGKYAPPTLPPDWKPAKLSGTAAVTAAAQATTAAAATGLKAFVSTAEAAKASQMDPKLRAAALGESQLPGKSVFDFLSQEARDRIAVATGRKDLPQARGEIPAEFRMTESEKRDEFLKSVPRLEKDTAMAAIARGARGGGPYQDDDAKRSRYRAYLEFQAGLSEAAALPTTRPAQFANDDDWLREFQEFFNCARIFKPMSGPMASRFTSAANSQPLSSGLDGSGTKAATDGAGLVSRPPPKPQDPSEEAAKLGMYGPLTRSVQEFRPTRLLCKRMGVRPPASVQPDQDAPASGMRSAAASGSTGARGPRRDEATARVMANLPAISDARPNVPSPEVVAAVAAAAAAAAAKATTSATTPVSAEAVVEASRNEALEGQRAGEDVFRAVFGDSDDDDDGA